MATQTIAMNWATIGSLGPDGCIHAAVVDSTGNLYIAGEFTMVGDVVASNIAKWNGSSWSALGSGIGSSEPFPYCHATVFALAVSCNDLYAGGMFTTAGDGPAKNIAKWNGSGWSPLGSGTIGFVNALAVSGSDLYAGGEFATAGGVEARFIAKWDGTSWSPLGSGIHKGTLFAGPSVNALALSGRDLYAGGVFEIAGECEASLIARWNGSSWSPLGSGIAGYGKYGPKVNAIVVLGSDVYAGGEFTTAGGTEANFIAKWNGSIWTALGSGICRDVYALVVSGRDVYAGGDFYYFADGSPANFVAKWDGKGWSAAGSGLKPVVHALAVRGSDLYAAGWCKTVRGTPGCGYIARAYLPTVPPVSVPRCGT